MTTCDLSIEQPTHSETAFQSPKKADAGILHSSSYFPVYSSDEEDDSRDRQSHWKRIKTRPDDTTSNGRTLIKWSDSREDASPVRRPLQTLFRRVPSPQKSSNPKNIPTNPPEHRVIVLRSRLQDGGHGLDVAAKDGGTASSQAMVMEAGVASSKRKFEHERRMNISMNIDMYERVREHQLSSRRLPGTAGRYEVRVREEGEFYDEEGDVDDEDVDEDHSGLFLEDSHPRPNTTVDLREALNRRARPLVANSENKGYGADGIDVKVRVRRVDFDLSCTSERSEVRKKVLPLPPSDAAQRMRIGVAKGSERDTEEERRRQRWAQKERDLERDLLESQRQALQNQELQKQHQLQLQQQLLLRQSMATTAQQPKSLTVVDYSHKFTVAKAPLGVPVRPVESDPHRLCQRQKQIDYGKNTLGYERYTEMVPRYQRTKLHPRTPDIRQVCSKRSWDGQIRKWRRLLHEYDPPKGEDDEDPDQIFVPVGELDGMRGAAADDCMMDVQSELVEEADLKIYDGWSDEEC